jgi:hypothetical protein
MSNILPCNLYVSANSDFKFSYSKEGCKAKDAWKQGAEKTLDIIAEGKEGGGKYVMNNCTICTLHKIITVTK